MLQSVMYAIRRPPRQEFIMEEYLATPVEHSSGGTPREMMSLCVRIKGLVELPTGEENNVLHVDIENV